jgi:CYTH domain-containing protein
MEIEFPDFSAAEKYQTPDWVIADVTADIRYKNGHLARYGIPEREDS